MRIAYMSFPQCYARDSASRRHARTTHAKREVRASPSDSVIACKNAHNMAAAAQAARMSHASAPHEMRAAQVRRVGTAFAETGASQHGCETERRDDGWSRDLWNCRRHPGRSFCAGRLGPG